MSLSTLNCTNFKGTTVNDKGVPCYKSNKGTIAGAIVSAAALGGNLYVSKMDSDDFEKTAFKRLENAGKDVNDKEIKERVERSIKTFERRKSLMAPFTLIAIACSLGAGILYDKMVNRKAQDAANCLAVGDFDGIYKQGGEIGTTAFGTPYYKSNDAIKFGALTGAACGLIHGAMDSISAKKFNFGNTLFCATLFGLGGVIVSSIVQKSVNKESEKSSLRMN